MPAFRPSLHHLLITLTVICTVSAVSLLVRDVNRIEEALPLVSLHQERDFAAFHFDLARLEAALDQTLVSPTSDHLERAAFALDLAFLRLHDNMALYANQNQDLSPLQNDIESALTVTEQALARAPAQLDMLRGSRTELGRLRQAFQTLNDTVFQNSMNQVSVQRENLASLRNSMTVLLVLFGIGGLSLAVLLRNQQRSIALLREQGETLRTREQTLRLNEAVLRQSQRVAKIGHYLFDVDTGRWNGSETLDNIFGIDANDPHDVSGWLSLIHPDDRDSMETYLKEYVLQKSQTFDREYRIIHRRSGSVHWVHGLGQLDLDADGSPHSMFGIIQDISERREAEEALRKREKEFRLLAENSPDPIIRYDRDGRRLYISPALTRLTGLSAEALLGKSLFDLPARTMDPHNAAVYADNVRHVLSSGEVLEWEIQNRATDGRVTILLAHAAPEFDENGEVSSVLVISRDITERKRAEEHQRLAASVFTTSQEGIVITDAQNRIIDVNEAFCRITGYERSEVLGTNPRTLRSGRQNRAFYQNMWESLATDGRWRGEIWNRRKSGELYAELLSIMAVKDDQGRLQNYVGVFSDISLLKEHEAELSRIAHFDPLTGIPNRRLLSDRLNQAINHAQRSGHPLAVCYLDLDSFKPVNDRFGHEAGDQLLVAVTEKLQGILRAGDTLARLGGDEFILLLTDLSLDLECFPILDRVLATVANPVTIADNEVSVTASIGVTLYPRDDADADTLLRHADQAMYLAKSAGKNRYYLFNPERD